MCHGCDVLKIYNSSQAQEYYILVSCLFHNCLRLGGGKCKNSVFICLTKDMQGNFVHTISEVSTLMQVHTTHFIVSFSRKNFLKSLKFSLKKEN